MRNYFVVQDCWKQESEKERIVFFFYFVKSQSDLTC